jgi:hypothetical protein
MESYIEVPRPQCYYCLSENISHYYTKPDGEVVIEYWRCKECTEVWMFIKKDNKIIQIKGAM